MLLLLESKNTFILYNKQQKHVSAHSIILSTNQLTAKCLNRLIHQVHDSLKID